MNPLVFWRVCLASEVCVGGKCEEFSAWSGIGVVCVCLVGLIKPKWPFDLTAISWWQMAIWANGHLKTPFLPNAPLGNSCLIAQKASHDSLDLDNDLSGDEHDADFSAEVEMSSTILSNLVSTSTPERVLTFAKTMGIWTHHHYRLLNLFQMMSTPLVFLFPIFKPRRSCSAMLPLQLIHVNKLLQSATPHKRALLMCFSLMALTMNQQLWVLFTGLRWIRHKSVPFISLRTILLEEVKSVHNCEWECLEYIINVG